MPQRPIAGVATPMIMCVIESGGLKMVLQGHPRSLILAPIENAYVISCWSSIVTLVLSCHVSQILQVSGEELPHLYSTRILGVFPLDWIADVVAPMSEDPKLIIRNLLRTSPTYMPTVPGTSSTLQTDGRTDDLR